MPILNLNGTTRKHGRIATGAFGGQGPSTAQHVPTGVLGTGYNSQFTVSDVAPLGTSINTATQPQLPALKAGAGGTVMALHQFQKVHPSENIPSLTPTAPIRVVSPGYGSPSPSNDVPSNPNKKQRPPARLVPNPHVPTEKLPVTTGSFLHPVNQTLSAHANHDVNANRWNTVKKGAAS